MKTSKFFFSTLIAAAAMTATAYAALSTYDATNKSVDWVSGNENAFKYTNDGWLVGTVGGDGQISWSSSTVEQVQRVNNVGWLLYFDGNGQAISVDVSGYQPDSSDGGGLWVTGVGNVVTVSAGRWAGSIQVDAGNVLNTSWSAQLKDGAIVANGIVNITSGNLNLDTGNGSFVDNRQWWVGAKGQINFSTANTLSGTGVVVSGALDTLITIDGLLNRGRELVVSSKDMVTFAAGLTSGLDSLSVGTIESTAANSTLSLVGTKDDLVVANQYYIEKSASGVRVYYTVEDYKAMDLAWAGTSDNSTWTEQGTNWVSSGVQTSFLGGDSVAFDGTGSGTISLESGKVITVSKAIISKGNYTWKVDSGKSTVSGSELEIASDATLKVGDSDQRVVDLNFEKVSVSGTLNYYNGADSWSSLVLDGGTLKLGDLPSGAGLSIASTEIKGTAAINADWDGNISLGALSGSGSLSVSGPTYGNAGPLNVKISGLSGYSGVLNLSKNRGLLVSLTGENVPESGYVRELGNENLELVVNDGVTLEVKDAFAKFTYKTLTMKNGSVFAFNNGNTWANRDISGTLNVDAQGGVVTLRGGTNGNSSNIAGKITGVGTISFEQVSGGGNNYNVSASISDKSDLEKLAVNVSLSATLVFSGNNTYTGGTTVENGTLAVTANNALGKGALTMNGGELQVATLTVQELGDGAQIALNGGKITGEGTLKLGADSSVSVADQKGGSIASEIAIQGNTTLSAGASATLKLSGDVSGSGSLSIDGGGYVELSGNNTYVGGTTVRSSHLVVKEISALGSGAITVEEGGALFLEKAGTIKNLQNSFSSKVHLGKTVNSSGTGDITDTLETEATWTVEVDSGFVARSGVINGSIGSSSYEGFHSLEKTGDGVFSITGVGDNQPGAVLVKSLNVQAGTLELVSGASALGWEGYANVSIASGAKLQIVAGANAIGAGDVTLADGAKLIIDLSKVAADADSITLGIVSSSAITLGETVLNGLTRSSEVILPEGYVSFENAGAFSEYAKSWSYDGNVLSLTLAIPEPSMFGLLAGLGALALAGTRRRRK